MKDDELDRLEVHLNQVKAEVCDAREHLSQIDRELAQATTIKEKRRQNELIDLQIQLARRNKFNEAQLQDLREQLEMEKYKISAEFEASIRNLSQNNQSELKGRVSDMDQRIAEAQNVLEKCREDLQTAREMEAIEEQKARDREQENYEIQAKTIAQLQTIIELKNQERVSNLIRSKQKLSDCVSAIEQMDEQHNQEVSERHRILEELETIYQNQLRQLMSEHRQRMMLLKTQKANTKKKLTRAQGSFQKLQETTRSEMKQSRAEFAYAQQKFAASVPVTFDEKMSRMQYHKCEKRKSEVTEARKVLSAKEEQLRRVREANSELRRKIGAAKHQYQYRKIITRSNM